MIQTVEQVETPAGDPAWHIGRYPQVKALLADSRLGRAHPDPARASWYSRDDVAGRPARGAETEYADHAGWRKAMNKVFSPSGLERMIPAVRTVAGQVADEMAAATPPADLNDSFAIPLTSRVMCTLLGIPAEDIDRVKRTMETERLRSALLTSISHDLKTPLASVLGAAGALRDMAKSLDDAAKADLLATIIDEAERLNRFIANLLDMTKLESGAVVPNATPHDVGEIVGSAIRRASKILALHNVEVDIAADLPMVSVDAVLLEQVLFNLLDNAAKYAPAETTIGIRSRRDADAVGIQVLDQGSGIPDGDLERIFEKFYRAQKGDRAAIEEPHERSMRLGLLTKLATKPKTMFIGGPVKRDAALCLATVRVGVDANEVPGLRHVQGRIAMVDLDADPDSVAPAVEGVRIYAGYSGWTIGQLDGEIERDDWIVLSALPSDVLVEPRVDLWSRVLRRQPLPLSLLASHPIDVSRN